MIEVEKLSKNFAGTPALSALSFTIQPGEVVGFLGQNGAGKSTTMRILSGYLPPSSGRARVLHYDVETHRDEVRARIGYLPESVPLYPELRVIEYLRFRARLKEVKKINPEVERVMQKTSLIDNQRQLIGTLSKGFRQRVGLADALLNNPPILLLDEPTEGLDPTQINAARGLIQELSKEHTVLLSTHILPEVERLCSRVLLLHRGRLAADLIKDQASQSWRAYNTPREQSTTIRLTLYDTQTEHPPKEALRKKLAKLPGVESASQEEQTFLLTTKDPRGTSEALVAFCHREELSVRELRAKEGSSLEELFLSLTTKEGAP